MNFVYDFLSPPRQQYQCKPVTPCMSHVDSTFQLPISFVLSQSHYHSSSQTDAPSKANPRASPSSLPRLKRILLACSKPMIHNLNPISHGIENKPSIIARMIRSFPRFTVILSARLHSLRVRLVYRLSICISSANCRHTSSLIQQSPMNHKEMRNVPFAPNAK